jgi:hypothetical protein
MGIALASSVVVDEVLVPAASVAHGGGVVLVLVLVLSSNPPLHLVTHSTSSNCGRSMQIAFALTLSQPLLL